MSAFGQHAKPGLRESVQSQFPSERRYADWRRYELIKWAEGRLDNKPYPKRMITIANSGTLKPIPALQDSINRESRVSWVVLVDFCIVKISYVVLPKELMEIFDRIKSKYSRTGRFASRCTWIISYFYKEAYQEKCRRGDSGFTTMESV